MTRIQQLAVVLALIIGATVAVPALTYAASCCPNSPCCSSDAACCKR